jgi:sugar phosphate isomerase/epimerase
MKIAIDSYCFHRYFGECYPGLQQDPGRRMTVWDFLRLARRLGVAGVSIESCFLPPLDDALLARLSDTLDDYGFERVWAWGHPNGLRSGTDRAAAKDLVVHLGVARRLGAKVMRIVGGSRRTRPKSWAVHRRRLLTMLRTLIGPARDHGVVMAMENHIDLTAAEMADLMNEIDSPWLGVCLDTANNVRLFEDPVAVARTLAPWTRATHVKDVISFRGDPKEFSFWPSVPLGEGAVDIPQVLNALKAVRYGGLLAIEVDYLHPQRGVEHAAVKKSVSYLRRLLNVRR